MMMVVLSLLFLPAAGQMIDGKSHMPNQWVRMWTNLASEASGMQLRSVLISCKGSDYPAPLTGGREEGRAIRLASRSGLSGCSVDGAGLLFLPAVKYWTSTASPKYSGGDLTAYRVLPYSPMQDMRIHRYSPYAIRLASRSGLFGCSFDGFGLLFLPAAAMWYWSFTSTLVTNAFGCVYIGNERIGGASSRQRHMRYPVRLASRSELFGCSVDGIRSSVPARCIPA